MRTEASEKDGLHLEVREIKTCEEECRRIVRNVGNRTAMAWGN